MSGETLSKPVPDRSLRVDTSAIGPKNATVDIVVISLPSATERRRKIEDLFHGTELAWSYFDAHSSLRHPGLRYDADQIRKRFGRTLSNSEIAICSSHVAVLSEFVERGSAEYILVLEDDILFDTDFPLNNFAAFCSANSLHYIRFYGKHYAEAIRLGFFYDRSIIRYKSSPAGAQAYLMSKAGARKFLDSFRSIDLALDLAMDEFWITQLPIYSIFPYPIMERFSPSSNPMPAAERGPQGWQALVFQYKRIVAKLGKIGGNIALRTTDRKMMRKSWHFQQIFDTKTK
jgi:glycosyl transferase family 25